MAADARDGHELIVVACCIAGPVAVHAPRRDAWRCGKCRSTGRDIERITLGLDGALPGNFDPLAASPRCWKTVVEAEGDAFDADGSPSHGGPCKPRHVPDLELQLVEEVAADAA